MIATKSDYLTTLPWLGVESQGPTASVHQHNHVGYIIFDQAEGHAWTDHSGGEHADSIRGRSSYAGNTEKSKFGDVFLHYDGVTVDYSQAGRNKAQSLLIGMPT